MHPIVGASSAEQLKDNLSALDLTLPQDAVRRLEDATDFTVGFPGDFIAEAGRWAFGEASTRLDA